MRRLLFRRALTLVLGPLFREGACEVESRHAEPLDENFAEAIARSLLLLERNIELFLCDQALLDEEGANQEGRDGWAFHGASIGNPSFEL